MIILKYINVFHFYASFIIFNYIILTNNLFSLLNSQQLNINNKNSINNKQNWTFVNKELGYGIYNIINYIEW